MTTKLTNCEIDALVAEKIMHLNVITKSHEYPADWVKSHKWKMDEPKIYVTNEIWNENFQSIMWGVDIIPHYSTDIAAAWMVVDKICAKGRNWRVNIAIDGESIVVDIENGDSNSPWKNPEDDPYVGVYVSDVLAPRAICLAALKSVGVEVDMEEKG